MKILFFAGSLRKESLNRKYLRVAEEHLAKIAGVETELVDLLDFPLPVFNQDIQDREFPQAATDFIEKISGADAVVISTPEYNGSISSVLKNWVDWSSRGPQNPWKGKPVFLMGASPGALGAVRGLWHSRIPLEVLGAHVYPEMSGLPRAHEAFGASGELKEKANQERLARFLTAFAEFAAKK